MSRASRLVVENSETIAPPSPARAPRPRSCRDTRNPNVSGGRDMKTSLGIWAFGSMATRFVPAGYKPERASETTVERVRRAVEGLGGLIDGYEFHYPQE